MLPAEFTVGWICALPIELAAAQGMLDQEYEESDLEKNPEDKNKYSLGQIAGHKVVLACLQSAGLNHASSAAFHMQYTFKHLKFILMVGIGGGIPNLGTRKRGKDVRLGDVVVSMPSGRHNGVIHIDSGKLLQGKDFLPTGALKPPPLFLQRVVNHLIARHESQENCIARYIQEMLQKHPKTTRTGTDYRHPGRSNDRLFRAEYVCKMDGDGCSECDTEQLISRPDRLDDEPVIHYGNIASGSSVVRDALKRDHLGKDCDALCVEMEAAGLMDEFDCLVIRGICDYADSHKNKDWQRYAAAAAAAYAKEFLGAVPQTSEASSRVPTSQVAGPSRSSSMVPTRTSSQFPLPHSEPPASPPLSQPQHFNTDEPMYGHLKSKAPSSSSLERPPQSRRFDTIEPASKAPPPSRSEGAWECREGENILVEDQIERCLSRNSSSQDADNMGQCDFRIFELRKDGYSLPTRRIAIRSCESGERCISFWMPLDNVHVEIEHFQVAISWSDCSNIHEASKGYRTTFTCRYIPEKPNRRLAFEIKNVSVIQDVAKLLLYPTLEYWHYEQNPVVTGSSKIDTLRLYKHRTGEEPTNRCVNGHTDFAILVSSNATGPTSYSKLYMVPACLDFRVDEVQDLLIFKKMRCLDYSSSLVKGSRNDILRHLNPEGGPDGWGWKTEDLELSPKIHKGLTMANLMTALTGWKLLFKEISSSVIVKGRVRSSKLKGALVTVWEREDASGRDVHLLVRASDARKESEGTTWLSTSLSSPVHLTIPEVTIIAIDVQACWRGPEVSIYQMTVDPRSASESRPQNIRLHFDSSNHTNNFYDVYRTTDQPLRQATTIGDRASAPWLNCELISVSHKVVRRNPRSIQTQSEQMTTTIATVTLDCQTSISNLLAAVTGDGYCASDILHSRDVEQMQDRFNQWAGNLGALQSLESSKSLEYRLRDAPLIRDSILHSLADLSSSIQAATDITLGKRQNRMTEPSTIETDINLSEYDLSSSESDSSSLLSSEDRNALAPTSEMQELISAIRTGLDSLFKASIFIRKFASESKRLRAVETRPFDNRADVMYIKDRYPLLNKSPALVARLGEANARRRQYFKYRRDHDERLSTVSTQGGSDNLKAQDHPVVTVTGPAKTVLTAQTKPSLLADTEATALMAEAAQARMLQNPGALEVTSEVSFATFVAETSDEELPFPPVPAEADNGSPFLCPYCFHPQQFKRGDLQNQWRKHVLRDLEPYICTFSACSLDTFHSQHAWFEHELLVHRSRWICSQCSADLSSSDCLKSHVNQHHQGLISNQQLSAFVGQSKRPIDCVKPSECPFCDSSWAQADSNRTSREEVLVVSLDQFRQHLGKHLQQVALFSLPRLIQGHDQSLGRQNDSEAPDRDAIPEGSCWIRDDCGYGWSIVSRRRATVIALAYFLNLCPAQETYALPAISYQDGSYKGRSYQGNRDLIQLLIDRGTTVGAGQEQYNEALQAAAHGGYEDMIQPLLNKKANVNAQGGKYGNVLRAAHNGGHGHIVQQLLREGTADLLPIPRTVKPPVSYVSYTLTKHPIEHVGQKETWAIVDRELIQASQADLKNQVEKHRKKADTGLTQYNDPDMKGFKRKQVDELIRECKAIELDHRFEYTVASIKRDIKRRQSGPETSAMQVILRRQTRPGVTVQGPFVNFGNLRLPMSRVVDLSEAEEDALSITAQDGRR